MPKGHGKDSKKESERYQRRQRHIRLEQLRTQMPKGEAPLQGANGTDKNWRNSERTLKRKPTISLWPSTVLAGILVHVSAVPVWSGCISDIRGDLSSWQMATNHLVQFQVVCMLVCVYVSLPCKAAS